MIDAALLPRGPLHAPHPRLARTAYAAADLDTQLDVAARRFLSDPANVAVDPAARVVRVSGVMGRRPGLIGTINRYQTSAAPTATYIADQSTRAERLVMKSAPVENWFANMSATAR